MEWHGSTKQLYVPPVCRDVTLEVEKKYAVYHYIDEGSYPHKSKIGSGTLDRIVSLNPAPYPVSNSDLSEGVDELTISSRTVEALYTDNCCIDGYQETQRDPKGRNDKEAANQVPPALTFGLSRTFRSFVTIADPPETNDSEGV